MKSVLFPEMKKYSLRLLILFTLSILSCSKSNQKSSITDRPSKWSPNQLDHASDNYDGSEFQRFQVMTLAYKMKFDIAPNSFAEKIKSGEINKIIKDSTVTDAYHYGFDVDKIAGKSPKQIGKLFGLPSKSEIVKPSRTPCPCPKKEYLDGLLEIVYINGKADWITINIRSGTITSDKFEVKRFDDYSYIKAFTD